MIDARTGTRWPTWAELDVTDPNPATRLLMVHPARNLTEGDRYIVALRDLKTADGSAIAPGPRSPRCSARPRRTPSVQSRPDGAYAIHLRSVVVSCAATAWAPRACS